MTVSSLSLQIMHALLAFCFLALASAGPTIAVLHFRFAVFPTEAGTATCAHPLDINFSESDLVGGLNDVQCYPDWHPGHALSLKFVDGQMIACFVATRELGLLERILLPWANTNYTCHAELKPKTREFKAEREGDIITISIDPMKWTFNRNDVKTWGLDGYVLEIRFYSNRAPFRLALESLEALGHAYTVVEKAMAERILLTVHDGGLVFN